jgi:hypothetical protein
VSPSGSRITTSSFTKLLTDYIEATRMKHSHRIGEFSCSNREGQINQTLAAHPLKNQWHSTL